MAFKWVFMWKTHTDQDQDQIHQDLRLPDPFPCLKKKKTNKKTGNQEGKSPFSYCSSIATLWW